MTWLAGKGTAFGNVLVSSSYGGVTFLVFKNIDFTRQLFKDIYPNILWTFKFGNIFSKRTSDFTGQIRDTFRYSRHQSLTKKPDKTCVHLFVIQNSPSVNGLIFFLQVTANNHQYAQFFVTLTWTMHIGRYNMLFYNRPFVVVTLLLYYKSLLKRTGEICRNYFCLSIKICY